MASLHRYWVLVPMLLVLLLMFIKCLPLNTNTKTVPQQPSFLKKTPELYRLQQQQWVLLWRVERQELYPLGHRLYVPRARTGRGCALKKKTYRVYKVKTMILVTPLGRISNLTFSTGFFFPHPIYYIRPPFLSPSYLRGTIVNRTYGVHKNLYI